MDKFLKAFSSSECQAAVTKQSSQQSIQSLSQQSKLSKSISVNSVDGSVSSGSDIEVRVSDLHVSTATINFSDDLLSSRINADRPVSPSLSHIENAVDGLVNTEEILKSNDYVTCDECQNKFLTQRSLVVHQAEEHGILPDSQDLLRCKFCPRKFLYPTSLESHEKSAHEAELSGNGDFDFDCQATPLLRRLSSVSIKDNPLKDVRNKSTPAKTPRKKKLVVDDSNAIKCGICNCAVSCFATVEVRLFDKTYILCRHCSVTGMVKCPECNLLVNARPRVANAHFCDSKLTQAATVDTTDSNEESSQADNDDPDKPELPEASLQIPVNLTSTAPKKSTAINKTSVRNSIVKTRSRLTEVATRIACDLCATLVSCFQTTEFVFFDKVHVLCKPCKSSGTVSCPRCNQEIRTNRKSVDSHVCIKTARGRSSKRKDHNQTIKKNSRDTPMVSLRIKRSRSLSTTVGADSDEASYEKPLTRSSSRVLSEASDSFSLDGRRRSSRLRERSIEEEREKKRAKVEKGMVVIDTRVKHTRKLLDNLRNEKLTLLGYTKVKEKPSKVSTNKSKTSPSENGLFLRRSRFSKNHTVVQVETLGGRSLDRQHSTPPTDEISHGRAPPIQEKRKKKLSLLPRRQTRASRLLLIKFNGTDEEICPVGEDLD